jgi:hypothetical protein
LQVYESIAVSKLYEICCQPERLNIVERYAKIPKQVTVVAVFEELCVKSGVEPRKNENAEKPLLKIPAHFFAVLELLVLDLRVPPSLVLELRALALRAWVGRRVRQAHNQHNWP